MEQKIELADNRLVNGCIYCGGEAETRDHVPSRILLDTPYPENLPVVGACYSCNQSFSKDEQYLVCLLGSVLAGTTDPGMINRKSVSQTLKRSPALRTRIEASKTLHHGRIVFNPDESRVKNVMLKLARGHAAFELSQLCRKEPDHYWCGALASLTENQRDDFSAAHIQTLLGEIGSRNMQRMFIADVTLESNNGEKNTLQVVVNDWIEVQHGFYRYLAIHDIWGIVIRIVVSEYLACEVGWQQNT